MKKTTIILVFLLLTVTGFGQEDPYRQAMTRGLNDLEAASTSAEYMNCANQFERIGMAEKDRWMPYYYGAYAIVIMSFNETDATRHDQVLDRAQQLIDHARDIAPGESEIQVLQSLLYSSRILVDPMARGMEYMEKTYQALKTAKTLNPDNPRIYFLEGVNALNLPESLGGGAAVALPIFRTAREKFEMFSSGDPLWPQWGEDQVNEHLSDLEE